MTEEKIKPEKGQLILYAVRRVLAPEGLTVGISSFEINAKTSICGLFVSWELANEWASQMNLTRQDKAFMFYVDEILLDRRLRSPNDLSET